MIRRLLIGVCAAALAVAPLEAGAAAPSRPDLRIARVSMPVQSVTAGASLKARVTTRNAGRRRAKRSTTTLYLSRDARRSVDDRRLASKRVPRLKKRRSKRMTIKARLATTVPPATGYRVLACADAPRRLRERNERNNCRAARGSLIVVAAGTGPVGDPSADDDGDGVRNSRDCSPHAADVHPGAIDEPDLPAAKDTNCDGIDGDETRAIFVSPIGDDAAPGTRSRPKRTMAAAVATARSQGKDVFATFGTYGELLNVADGVGVYGGYGTDWTRSLAARTRLTGGATGGPTAALAIDVTRRTVLQHIGLEAGPAVGAGAGSYGLRAARSPGLVIERVAASGGTGANGSSGATGPTGLPGGAGRPGGQGYCAGGTPLAAGLGGTSPAGRTGGAGGAGAPTGDNDGAEGSPGLLTLPDAHGRMGGPGGAGGDGGDPGDDGVDGYAGDSGTIAADGAGGTGGGVVGGAWLGSPGQPGGTGTPGHGGGGGGGGGGQGDLTGFDGSGNSGGGGGGGGAGGRGGGGGGAGGGSFGLFLVDSSGAVIRQSVVSAANGGTGRGGGSGGFGGAGGASGPGAAACTDEIGKGGDGGLGGGGGLGGSGGGGAGGPSIALFRQNSATTGAGNTLTFGAGGAGGGGPGSPGAPGSAAATN